mmetsp:Transcript_15945/g.18630  ORF Transcript_15945/g.18630 Transcript_15945/m.18630 type:complete len:91 (-) Transcript_15945:380-652(-)
MESSNESSSSLTEASSSASNLTLTTWSVPRLPATSSTLPCRALAAATKAAEQVIRSLDIFYLTQLVPWKKSLKFFREVIRFHSCKFIFTR